MDQCTPFDPQKEIKISFIKMDHPQSMDLGRIKIFLNHESSHLVPALVCVGVANGIVEKVNLALEEGETFGI
jgi:hypothetical protein